MMRKLWALLAAAVLVVVGAGIAWASIPGPDGEVNGCYRTTNGDLRVIDSSGSCAADETSLDWDQFVPGGTIYDAQAMAGSYSHSTGSPIQVQTCPNDKVTVSAWAFTSAKLAVPAQINHQAPPALGTYMEIHGTSSIPNGTTVYWGMVCAHITS